MLVITDKLFFAEIVADAVMQAHLTCRSRQTRNRWIRAIAKGAGILLEGNMTFLHWEPNQEILFYWSAESNESYQIVETCACPAYLQPKRKPCYHRAMRQLLKNYYECIKKPGEIFQIDFADAVFFDSELSIKQKFELLNLCILEGRSNLKAQVEGLRNFPVLNLKVEI